MIYALLRVPGIAGDAVVFDDDHIESSNRNRYSLFRSEDIALLKTQAIERWSTTALSIRGIPKRYVSGSHPGANRMVVGADDIAVRWTAQRDSPAWLGVGATSHLFSIVSTHRADDPCAGCTHDHEDAAPTSSRRSPSSLDGTALSSLTSYFIRWPTKLHHGSRFGPALLDWTVATVSFGFPSRGVAAVPLAAPAHVQPCSSSTDGVGSHPVAEMKPALVANSDFKRETHASLYRCTLTACTYSQYSGSVLDWSPSLVFGLTFSRRDANV